MGKYFTFLSALQTSVFLQKRPAEGFRPEESHHGVSESDPPYKHST